MKHSWVHRHFRGLRHLAWRLSYAGRLRVAGDFRLSHQELSQLKHVSLDPGLITHLSASAAAKMERFEALLRATDRSLIAMFGSVVAYLFALWLTSPGAPPSTWAPVATYVLLGMALAGFIGGCTLAVRSRRLDLAETELRCEVRALHAIRAARRTRAAYASGQARHSVSELSEEDRVLMYRSLRLLGDTLLELRGDSRPPRQYRRTRKRLARQAAAAAFALADEVQQLPAGLLAEHVTNRVWHLHLKIATGNWRQIGQTIPASDLPRRHSWRLTRQEVVTVVTVAVPAVIAVVGGVLGAPDRGR